ncbi:uncharacterized protein LOC135958078 [Calliphora vicina]|uniref:uncharacterized protein LOC135958078 n=1 Tax=Calliphora vicina TaxID=7373 RepID=UPI00325BAECE
MKVTIVLLAAVFCFAAVNAASFEKAEAEPIDLLVDEAFADEIVDFEARSVFSGFYWVLKAALRSLKGVNCTIKQAIIIKGATLRFLGDINMCGADAVSAFSDVITAAQSVITTCNNIIHLNENVCNNDVSTNGKPSTPFSCFVKLLRQLLRLRNQIKNTLSAIKKVPAVPGEAAGCSKNAVSDLTDAFLSFPANVKTCSKLTH